mmetsp:Transcript_330/g.1176  ORF Transcript_330/g.1176 Transcript_330/m.1176 type:complete len:403 (-) Transcript_330:50-1258(-)
MPGPGRRTRRRGHKNGAGPDVSPMRPRDDASGRNEDAPPQQGVHRSHGTTYYDRPADAGSYASTAKGPVFLYAPPGDPPDDGLFYESPKSVIAEAAEFAALLSHLGSAHLGAAAAPGAAAVATRDLRFNERHYGAVQGICKNDAALHAVYGTATVKLWRRSMHAAPPPVTEDHPHWLPPPAPRTESLSDCRERCLSGFDARVWPALFDSGQRGSTVLLVAHANTLRALMSSFDGIADEDIPKLHVPNSVPIIYRFDEETRMPLSRKLGSAAGGSHARWLLSHTNHHKIEAALQPGGMLTRALFESWDEDGNRSLTASEIRRGLKSLSAADVGVAAVARRIVRNLTLKFDVGEGSEICTLEEFEATAKRVGSRLADELEDVDDLEKTGYNEYVKPGYAGPAPN